MYTVGAIYTYENHEVGYSDVAGEFRGHGNSMWKMNGATEGARPWIMWGFLALLLEKLEATGSL